MFNNRRIVSFEGKCQMNCKHCFALEQENEYLKNDVEAIVKSLEQEEFDIIYVSHNKENFSCAEEGLRLCCDLYEKYGKDICVTSRCVLDDNMIDILVRLNEKMKKSGKKLFWCESIPALESASITEDLSKIPTPEERIKFLGALKSRGIYSIIFVRPLFPDTVISSDEIGRLIAMVSDKVDAVITGGLVITEEIDKRLGLRSDHWKYLADNESSYLVGAISKKAKFVDVRSEMKNLKKICYDYGVNFFEHSLQAINYLNDNMLVAEKI